MAGVLVVPAGPAVASSAEIVVDGLTGEVLYERRGDHRHYPASLTKMMTLYLLFEALDSGQVGLDTRFKVSARAAGQPASKLGLKKGTTIRVQDAILALIVKSANDVATVVAEGLGGKEWKFAEEMTKKARSLGMSKTKFRNANGLPNTGQISTVRDMARLARALYLDFPHHYHYFSTKSFVFGGKTYTSHNRILASYRGADGLKTGYIRASKFNLVTSAERNGRRVIGVVFGAGSTKTRDRRMVGLLDRGFNSLKPITTASINVKVPRGTPAPPPPKPVIASDAPWAIQVGAFSRLESAYAALRESLKHIPGIVASATAVVIPIEEGDGGLYRARFVGVSWQEARRGCRILVRKRLDCEVVQHFDSVIALSKS